MLFSLGVVLRSYKDDKTLDSPPSLWHTLFMDTVHKQGNHKVRTGMLARPKLEALKTMAAPTTEKTITVTRKVFDLDSKDYVELQKTGTLVPVTTMAEFTERLGNRADLILELANKALAVYEEERLAADESAKWMVPDDEDEEKLVEFSGNPLSEEKGKTLQASVISFAKLLFGYSKNMVPGDKKANADAKKVAKEQALAAILSAPGAIERLK